MTVQQPEILSAVPVAFARDGSLDMAGTREILEYVAGSQNEGAFILGTTGEFPSLSFDERAQIVQVSAEILTPHMRVVAHVGAASAWQAQALVGQARAAGIVEVAAITPYYLRSSDSAILHYYESVASSASGMRLFAYVFREVTGNAVSAELLVQIAAVPNVVGVKVSGEPLETLDRYRAAVSDSFVIYTGSDRDLARAAAHGAQGVVSGISSVLPKPFRRLAGASESAGEPERREAQAAVDDVVETLAGDLARMKAAYRFLGVRGGYVRMAVEEPSASVMSDIERVVRTYA